MSILPAPTALLTAPGAVAVADLDPADPDAGAVAHYGDPAREQRTLATAVGLVDRSHRQVLTLTGPDRLTWLHSLTTQWLTGLSADGPAGTQTLVLSPHGHIEHHLGVVDDGATCWLDVEPGTAEGLLSFLTRMVFLTRVSLADTSADWAQLALVGPATDEALARLGVPALASADVLAVPPPKFTTGSIPARPTSRHAVGRLPGHEGWVRRVPGGADLLVPRSAALDLAGALGVPLAGVWAYEAIRVASGTPRLGFETDHRTLPAEAGWTASAVHLEKGCYRGQETVARVHHLGRPPRRLVLVHLDGLASDHLPARHTPVTGPAGGRAVGVLGTAVRHHELGLVGLALVRANVAVDATLQIGEFAAMIDAP